MPLTLLLGGARSGKSSLAVRLAEATGRPVTYVATAEALDEEMAERIDRHRRERPSSWRTVEEPHDLLGAITTAQADDCVVVDCLTLWTSNVHHRGEGAVLAEAAAAASAAAARLGPTVVVSNEVGMGIVPADPATRAWRDLHGQVNNTFAELAADVLLVVAGRALRLADAGEAVT